MAVAVDQHIFKPFDRTQRCKRRSYTQMDSGVFELDPTALAHSLKQVVVAATNIHRSFSTPCLSLSSNKVEDDPDTGPRIELLAGRGATGVRALVVEAAIAMASGSNPEPIQNGLGGAYILCGRNGDKVAVAKPIDEEPLAMNNPKGCVGRILGQPGLKSSVRIGETGSREVAAYLLDHEGFAGVPPTALVKISHVAFCKDTSELQTTTTQVPKISSLQRFVDHDFDAGDLGPSGYSVSSVHRIGILDIRLLNLDRHAGNILVKKAKQEIGYVSESYVVGAAELVPIDHGLCLPEVLDDPYFEWLHWPQASVPFSESEVEYISRLDPLKDAEILRAELPSIREFSIRILLLCTIFLKAAVSSGLCLADIGDMMTREFHGTEQDPSILEVICQEASATMKEICEHEGNDTSPKEVKTGAEQSDEDFDIFQFDKEYEDSNSEVLGLPRLLSTYPPTGKPPRIPSTLPSTRSMSAIPQAPLLPLREVDDTKGKLNSEDSDRNEIAREENVVDEDKDARKGGLTKCVSFLVSKCESEDEGISFKWMNEEEWNWFLESFRKLLPKAFEERKSIGLKQRLGTSCKF